MEVSLARLLLSPFFSRSAVLAGEKGLSNKVSSVTVLDSPDAPKYLKGGELVITTAYSLLNDPATQQAVIQDLAIHGAAGLGIKLRFFNNELPKVMKDKGDELNFPIISLPDEYAYTDILEFVMSNIISERTQEIKRIDEVYKEINQNLHDDGLTGVAKTLYKWTNLRAAVLFGEKLYLHPSDMWPEDFPKEQTKWMRNSKSRLSSGNVYTFSCKKGDSAYQWLASDILVKGRQEGSVILLEGAKPFDKNDYNLLDYAASACAMEIQRIRSVKTVERKYRKQFLERLLQGEYSWEEARFQVREFDMNLPLEAVVSVINIQGNNLSLDYGDHVESIDGVIVSLFGDRVLRGLLDRHNIIMLLENDSSKNELLIDKLYSGLQSMLGTVDFIIGLGRAASFNNLTKSYNEAKQAIQIGSCLNLRPRIYYFNKLGFYRLLQLPEVNREIKNYFEDYLKPLVMQDKEHKSGLLDTLKCYVENGFNYRVTARKMFVHPNTVRYRIATIEKLCRVNLKLADDRLNMEIALKILPLLQRTRE